MSNLILEGENDEVLMLSFKDGNEEAFDEIVKRYKNKVFNYVYKYIKNNERSEEITQEVFIRIYKSRSRYKVKAKFSTYIYKIAVNLAYNEIRDLKRRKTQADDKFEKNLKEYHTPDKIYEKKEVEQIVNDEINKLEDKYKDVIILCNLEGRSYKEIAEILDISLGTVQSRLNRARAKLKLKLENIFLNKKV